MAGFWVAGAVVLLGLASALVWAMAGALSAVASTEDLARADLPGTVRTPVTEARTLVVYYEGEPVPELGELALRVTGPSGGVVPVEVYEPDLEYDSPVAPGTVGTAVASFRASAAGAYRVDSPFMPETAAKLAVGEDVSRGFAQTMVGPTLLAAGAVLLALLIAFVTAVRINSRYRAARSGAPA